MSISVGNIYKNILRKKVYKLQTRYLVFVFFCKGETICLLQNLLPK